ncbi:MAG: TonB family protein [Nitrospiraceae bacterium]|nr:MAG: TonB family protein [Nitrospiraceae bacterium]
MVSPHRQYRLQGWVVSAFVHGLAMTVALGLMAQVKPELPKDPFTWDVALVEPQRIHETSQAEVTPTQEPAKPIPHPATPAPSQPKIVTREAQPRKVTPVAQHESRQVVETSQPIEQTVAVQTRTEPVTPVIEQQPSEVQQTEQFVDEPVTPLVQHEAALQPEITDAPIQPLEARVGETTPVTQDSNLSALQAADASDAKPVDSVAQEPTPQVATATRPTPAVKVNYGWLAESLRRRLAEIKRYPSTARLNGWEGKVVLRAVIRSDGHLSEVKVHRSSGHEALDNAAVEAIRLVCPLHMHQPLGTSEVAVYVPMVYSLGS